MNEKTHKELEKIQMKMNLVYKCFKYYVNNT